MKKFRDFACDLLFVISAIVGVGFATGREIGNFFLNGKYIFLSVGIFVCFFAVFCWLIISIKNKYNIESVTQFNKVIFGKLDYVLNIFLLILFIVTSSAMLSGCDNIFCKIFDLKLPIFSMFLSIITFFVILGGVKCIKRISNIVMPILIVMIAINVIGNFNIGLFEGGGVGLSIVMPLLFCGENCVTLISVLLKTKSEQNKLSIISSLLLGIIILISLFAINSVKTYDMPLVETSKNLGNVFYLFYIICVVSALFITLQISSYNSLEICSKNKQDKWFIALLIILFNQALSFLGFTFIVKYLYAIVGFLGMIYIGLIFIRLIVIKLKK